MKTMMGRWGDWEIGRRGDKRRNICVYIVRHALCTMRFSDRCPMLGGYPRNMKMSFGLGFASCFLVLTLCAMPYALCDFLIKEVMS